MDDWLCFRSRTLAPPCHCSCAGCCCTGCLDGELLKAGGPFLLLPPPPLLPALPCSPSVAWTLMSVIKSNQGQNLASLSLGNCPDPGSSLYPVSEWGRAATALPPPGKVYTEKLNSSRCDNGGVSVDTSQQLASASYCPVSFQNHVTSVIATCNCI